MFFDIICDDWRKANRKQGLHATQDLNNAGGEVEGVSINSASLKKEKQDQVPRLS